MSTQQLSDARQPMRGRFARAIPQMLIKPRRFHSGTVTAGVGQAPIAPRHPSCGQFALGQTLELRIILTGGWSTTQSGDMPRTADYSNALETLLTRRPQLDSHRRLAPLFVDFWRRLGIGFSPQRAHQFPDGLEQFSAVLALFDQMLPPALAFAVTSGFGNPAQWIVTRIERGKSLFCIRI